MIQQQLIKAEKMNSTLLSEKELIEQKAGKLVYLVLLQFVAGYFYHNYPQENLQCFLCLFDPWLFNFYQKSVLKKIRVV